MVVVVVVVGACVVVVVVASCVVAVDASTKLTALVGVLAVTVNGAKFIAVATLLTTVSVNVELAIVVSRAVAAASSATLTSYSITTPVNGECDNKRLK